MGIAVKISAGITTSLLALMATVGARPAAAAAPTPESTLLAHEALARMSEAQRVGQLFLLGTPADTVTDQLRAAVAAQHLGGVVLSGRSTAGVASVAAANARRQGLVTSAGSAGVKLLVATDQEGGQVQVLSGPGFSDIPSALEQGRLSPTTLRSDAAIWGRQLRRAGVELDLAPVAGVVPGPAGAEQNQPIGRYHREYGYSPSTVSPHVTAFAAGLTDAAVGPTVKHFPGLGRADGNTDVSTGVTDRVTTRHDPYLAPFAAAVAAGVPFVMVSTAIYSRIDPGHMAAFSPTVVTGMLRGDLGFTGVVVSDSLSAAQVSTVPVADRAADFIAAGGDLAVVTRTGDLGPMYDGVLARTQHDAHFRAQVDAAALRVLKAKAGLGLVPRTRPGNHYYLSDDLHGTTSTDFAFGRAGDTTVVGRWGGGKADVVGVRRSNIFYLPAHNGGPAPTTRFGSPEDEPLAGDWNGDGRETIGVRRGNTFYLTDTLGDPATHVFAFGSGPDKDEVLVGDWNGDGRDTVGVRRGNMFYLTDTDGDPATHVFAFGSGPDKDQVVVGDWNGDGRDTVGVRRGNTFYLTDTDGDPATHVFRYGSGGDQPLAGDWDGNGTTTVGVRR